MNDFTKEELENLANCVGEYTSTCSKGYHDLIYPELYNKIQSMIDNYCEHDGEIGKDYPAEKCMKCNGMWE